MTVGALRWVSFFYGTAKTAGLKTGSTRGRDKFGTAAVGADSGMHGSALRGHRTRGLVPY